MFDPAHLLTRSATAVLMNSLQKRFELRKERPVADEVTSLLRKAAASASLRNKSSNEALSLRINLANMLKATEKFAEAEAEFPLLLEDCPRVFGANSRSTLMTRGSYADLLFKTRRLDFASCAYRDVIRDMRATLGSNDGFTLTAITNYASGPLHHLKMVSEAVCLLREAFAGIEVAPGSPPLLHRTGCWCTRQCAFECGEV